MALTFKDTIKATKEYESKKAIERTIEQIKHLYSIKYISFDAMNTLVTKLKECL